MSDPGRRAAPERARQVALALGLLAIVALAHFRVAFRGETFVARDSLEIMLPAQARLGDALRAGRIPEWDDSVGIGVPFAANPLHGVSYPPYWLVALLPTGSGGDWLILLHLAVGAMGVAAFARRLESGTLGAGLAGGIFAACGYVASMPANHNAQLLCWVPWVACAADRVARPAREGRRPLVLDAAGLAAAFAAQLVVGEPTHVVTSLLLASIVVLVRAERRPAALGRAAAAIAAALPLAAASLLPALGVLDWSTRAGGLAPEEQAIWSLAPIRALEWIWRGLLGAQIGPGGITENLSRVLDPQFVDAVQRTTWAFSVYFGIPGLALAGWAALGGRAERLLLAASAVFVLLALGPATPLSTAFAWAFPPAGLARYPEKYLVGCWVVWSALAGVGFGRLVRRGVDRSLLLLALGGALLLAVLLGGGALWQPELSRWLAARAAHAALPFDAAAGLRRSLLSGASALGVAMGFALLLGLAARRQRVLFACAAAVLLLGELLAHGWSVAPTMPRARLDAPPRLLAGIPAAQPPALRSRIWIHSRRALMPADLANGTAYGEYTFQSAGGDIATRYGFAALPGASPVTGRALSRLMDLEAGPSLLGVDYVVVAKGLVEPGQFPLLAQDPALAAEVLRTRGARPRAFVAPRWIRSRDPLSALPQAARSGDAGVVVVEGEGDLPPAEAAGEAVGPCTAASGRPERVDLVCSSRLGGYATLLDAYAPGWRATVDDRPARIEAADATFRAVRVGPGTHRIRFSYETPWLRAGTVVALASWIAWVVVVLAASFRRSG